MQHEQQQQQARANHISLIPKLEQSKLNNTCTPPVPPRKCKSSINLSSIGISASAPEYDGEVAVKPSLIPRPILKNSLTRSGAKSLIPIHRMRSVECLNSNGKHELTPTVEKVKKKVEFKTPQKEEEEEEEDEKMPISNGTVDGDEDCQQNCSAPLVACDQESSTMTMVADETDSPPTQANKNDHGEEEIPLETDTDSDNLDCPDSAAPVLGVQESICNAADDQEIKLRCDAEQHLIAVNNIIAEK